MIHNIHNCTSCVYISVQFDVHKHVAIIHYNVDVYYAIYAEKANPLIGTKGTEVSTSKLGGWVDGTLGPCN